MRDLLQLCTGNVDFSYNSDIYIQTNGVTISSALGRVLAIRFLIEL